MSIEDIQNGVGDDVYSYSYDGVRQQRWHNEIASEYGAGITWQKGDRIGCVLSYHEHGMEISYILNEIMLGTAFSITGTDWYDLNSTTSKDTPLQIFAVISSEVEEKYALHLGQPLSTTVTSGNSNKNLPTHSLFKYPMSLVNITTTNNIILSYFC